MDKQIKQIKIIEKENLFKKSVLFYKNLVKSKSKYINIRRQEFILNIIITSSILFISIISFIYTYLYIYKVAIIKDSNKGEFPFVIFFVLLSFLLLYFLSRKGFSRFSAYILIFLYFVPTTYGLYKWGSDLPMGLLIYILLVTMAGILISTRFAFILFLTESITLITLTNLQINGIFKPISFWRNENITMSNAIEFSIVLGVILILTWLHNREMEKALRKARKSEKLLLEIRVKERTEELKIVQEEKISQLYHFYEFGQLSAGIFHDLINKLAITSLGFEQLQDGEVIKRVPKDIEKIINRAIGTIDGLNKFVSSAQKQIKTESKLTLFFINNEIESCLSVMKFKFNKFHVKAVFDPYEKNLEIHGDEFKFNQILANLISNAIDAYKDIPETRVDRKVMITVSEEDKMLKITIQDWAIGISKENIKKIFTSFFTTKETMGLGLYTAKKNIEKYFHGSITVESELNKGSIFTIKIPLNN